MAKARRWMQLFSALLFAGAMAYPLSVPWVKLIFKADSALVYLALISARAMAGAVALSAFTLIATLIFGRVFCGWLCPMGAIIDAVDFITGIKLRLPRWRVFKYHLLAAFIGAALIGVFLPWYIDPMNWASRLAAAAVTFRVELLVFLFIIFAFFVISIIFGRRGFCRSLCPTGALLGVVSGYSAYGFRVSEKCIDCGTCVNNCRAAAFENKPTDHNKAECVHCRECELACPTGAISFQYFGNPNFEKPDGSRRMLLASFAAGAVAAIPIRILAAPKKDSAELLRPPGTVPDHKLASQCLRCGACIRTCPTGGIKADFGQGGILLFQAPYLSGRDGGCEYECNKCGLVCPTHAIKKLDLQTKQNLKIGIAKIDKTRCIPHSRRSPCLACFNACPVDAIALRHTKSTWKWGGLMNKPWVIKEKCIGCGLCEAACPVEGKGAIYTLPLKQDFI